jgi:hypothetical protein
MTATKTRRISAATDSRAKRSAPGRRITGAASNLLPIEYHLLCVVQAPFEFVFWALEQRKGQLADKLENDGHL